MLRALEDVGYFCVDNLPLTCCRLSWHMQAGASREGRRIALVHGRAHPGLFAELCSQVFHRLEKQGFKLHLIFLEADEETLIRRFSQTRRQHPLADHDSISQALREERHPWPACGAWPTASSTASFYNPHQLRELIKDEYSDLAPRQRMWLHLISFAYKNGIPPEADMVMDVRFLPNPYFVDGLTALTGDDPRVRDYVLEQPETQAFLEHLLQLRGLPVALLPGGRQDPPHPGGGLHRGPAPLGGHRQRPGGASDPGQFIPSPSTIATCRGPQETINDRDFNRHTQGTGRGLDQRLGSDPGPR